jgi:hypothetical protein
MEQSAGVSQRRSAQNSQRLRLGAVIAVALLVGFLAWMLLRGDDDSGPKQAEPAAATESDLLTLDSESGHPVYWVGPRPGTKYEVTQTGNRNVYIRYLPKGVPLGDERPNYLTVGSYPFAKAYATLKQSARRKGVKSGSLPNDGIYVVNRERPNSVYVGYPETDVQIEVFAPSASQARQLVISGKLRPVG